MSQTLIQPLKWWGGKKYLAKKFIGLMPRHLHYVEPYAGGLAVLLEKDPFDRSKYWGDKGYEQGVSEVVNDVYRELTNFWRVIHARTPSPRSSGGSTPCRSRRSSGRVPRRNNTLATIWMLKPQWHFLSAADKAARVGSMISPPSAATGRGGCRMNRRPHGGIALKGCQQFRRLRRVVILNEPALDVIHREDGEKTLFYLDPPYLHETRAATGTYKHEMDEEDHRQLLTAIKQCQGKIMLSGYPNPLYDKELVAWRRRDFIIDNKAAGGKIKREMTESVWMNF